MSQVTFNIKILVDGKEKVVEAKTDVSKLADEFEKAKNSSTKLRDKLLEFNQAAQAFQNLTSGVQQLVGVFGQFSQAYADQEAAQTRLAVNMRNTMDAREEDIQSILDLVAAQQQLGVVGDEVQLVGAQELATYLSKKESLEQLIPVMNDMLVQQYGLNASQESAQNIATMLGKVMDGQVGALSRYGYKFDEAQEQVLKFGTEEQRAAVLTDVVTSAVGGMNAALAQTDAGKAKQMANNMGDLELPVDEVEEVEGEPTPSPSRGEGGWGMVERAGVGGALPVGDDVEREPCAGVELVAWLELPPRDGVELDEDGGPRPCLFLLDELYVVVPEVDVADVADFGELRRDGGE